MPLSACRMRSFAVWTVLAESRHGTVNDARIVLARGFVIESKPGERADAVILQHDVAALDQAEEQLLAPRVLEVDDEAPLVAV